MAKGAKMTNKKIKVSMTLIVSLLIVIALVVIAGVVWGGWFTSSADYMGFFGIEKAISDEEGACCYTYEEERMSNDGMSRWWVPVCKCTDGKTNEECREIGNRPMKHLGDDENLLCWSWNQGKRCKQVKKEAKKDKTIDSCCRNANQRTLDPAEGNPADTPDDTEDSSEEENSGETDVSDEENKSVEEDALEGGEGMMPPGSI